MKLDIENWSEEWPTEEGVYFFFGGMKHRKEPELSIVRVGLSGNGCWMYFSNYIMYKGDGTFGFWSPKLDLSSLPVELWHAKRPSHTSS